MDRETLEGRAETRDIVGDLADCVGEDDTEDSYCEQLDRNPKAIAELLRAEYQRQQHEQGGA